MKVTIIIPVYLVELYIKDCLKSVYNQKYNNIEVILVNDCTPDRSMELAKEFVDESSLPAGMEIKFLEHERNRGVSAARNTGTSAATGDYIYYLDSDDEIDPDCISLLVQPLKKMRYNLILGDYSVVGERGKSQLNLSEGEVIGNNKIFHEYCFQNIYSYPWNKLCNREFLIKNSLYFREGLSHEDDLWSFQMSMVAESMYVIKQNTYLYKIREDSFTTTETVLFEINTYIKISELINSMIKGLSANEKYDVYHYLDVLYGRRYIRCIWSKFYNEYKQLRKNDIRSWTYLFRKSLSSKQYLRCHGHCLFPPVLGYGIYILIMKYMLN